jgi:hypothetical protein
MLLVRVVALVSEPLVDVVGVVMLYDCGVPIHGRVRMGVAEGGIETGEGVSGIEDVRVIHTAGSSPTFSRPCSISCLCCDGEHCG